MNATFNLNTNELDENFLESIKIKKPQLILK